jgi:hypothetical protein
MANNIYLPPSPVVPGALIITAITNTYPMVVSFINSIYNTYALGQLVCLTVPPQYGMVQANELTGEITNISGTNFTLNIDASNFDPFVIPPPSFPPPSRPASLSPAGSRNIYNITVEPFRALNGQQGN